MFIPLQGGKVDKTIRSLAMSSQEAVQTEKALEVLATMNGPDLNELANDKTDNGISAATTNTLLNGECDDITAEFIKPLEKIQPDLPESDIFVYKGILMRLAGLSGSWSNDNVQEQFMGVFAGKDSTVMDVILAPSLESALNTPEVLNRWLELGYQVLGLAVYGSMDAPDTFGKELSRLLDISKSDLILLAFNGSMSPCVWMVRQEGSSNDELSWSRVTLCRGRGRQKGDNFTVVSANKVGVTFTDEAGRSGHCCITEMSIHYIQYTYNSKYLLLQVLYST